MLKIKNTAFKEKFTEINIRQRMYQKKSIITVQFTMEFYPTIVNDQIVSGAIDIKLDLKKITSLDDLSNKTFKGDIGSVTISVNNNGIWEHQTVSEFEMKLGARKGSELPFHLRAKDIEFESVGTIVSLYTTSSAVETLEKEFDMKDFYSQVIKKEVGSSIILKFIARNEENEG